MKIIFFMIVLVNTANAFRLRENSNVLVPNNDVNVHANIKKLLSDNDFDPEEVNAFVRLLRPVNNLVPHPPPSPSPQLPPMPPIIAGNSIDNEEEISSITALGMTTHTHKRKRSTTRSTTQGFQDNFAPEAGAEMGDEEPTDDKSFLNASSTKPTTTEFYNISIPELTTENSYNLTTLGYNLTTFDYNTTVDYDMTTLGYTTTTFGYNTTTMNYNATTFGYNTTTVNYNTTTPGYDNTTLAYNTTTTENFYNYTTSMAYFNITTTTEISTDTSNQTTETATLFTTPSIPTTTVAEQNPTANEECLLGKVSETLKWVAENGTLQMNFIKSDKKMKDLKSSDYSRRNFSNFLPMFGVIEVLSLAYNGFDELPNGLLNQFVLSLKYLSLAGNNFKDMDDSLMLPNLEELDLRKCGFMDIKRDLLKNLKILKRLYLSENNIINLRDDSFNLPSLVYLDLSSNREDAPNQSPLALMRNVFTNLTKLAFLDLSRTKLDTKSVGALNNLPCALIGISFCYTELATSDNFLAHLTKIKYLDLSGNPQMNFTMRMFSNISNTLIRLEVKDANVRNLEWTHPLIKLKILNLKDNKLKNIDNNSFSHMLDLEDLNLSKNSIVNWYSPLFAQNQELKTLNLRENALSNITSDMKEDLLKVQHLALGNNAFECSCVLYDFMNSLFESTKDANLTKIEEGLNIIPSQTPTLPVALGMRNVLRPEYDIMTRTYQKYYDQIKRSIEALKKNNYSKKSKSFMSVMMSRDDNAQRKAITTVLLDYDEYNQDYHCINVTAKELQSMLDLEELCDNHNSRKPPYENDKVGIIIALSASIPSVLGASVLLFIIYWKWWYIRYFFVLCKNSAILSFMDDDDGGKEAIVRRKSSSSIDIFLYDVFVSYSDQNRTWVLDEFIPNIERRESINVCLHERDFQVGYGILENIVSCMDRSRCLLLLVSEQFLQSQWCQFEMNLAQHRLLETRKEKLILVLLEDIPVRKQTKTLKYLMRTKTYIKWPCNGTNEEKQLFWKRLKKSIISSKWEYDNYGSSNA